MGKTGGKTGPSSQLRFLSLVSLFLLAWSNLSSASNALFWVSGSFRTASVILALHSSVCPLGMSPLAAAMHPGHP
eukprot:5784563-Amphidinium_carterae.1